MASVNLACVRSRGRYSQVTVGREIAPRQDLSRERSRRVAARRDEISLKRGSETAQALTGGRRHVQEGVLSSRRLRDRGTSKSENPGDPVSCSCVARARAGTGHSAASAASHAPSRFCTFAAARRSPQPRPVRQNVRDRTPRVTEPRDSARAHVVDLSFEVAFTGTVRAHPLSRHGTPASDPARTEVRHSRAAPQDTGSGQCPRRSKKTRLRGL